MAVVFEMGWKSRGARFVALCEVVIKKTDGDEKGGSRFVTTFNGVSPCCAGGSWAAGSSERVLAFFGDERQPLSFSLSPSHCSVWPMGGGVDETAET